MLDLKDRVALGTCPDWPMEKSCKDHLIDRLIDRTDMRIWQHLDVVTRFVCFNQYWYFAQHVIGFDSVDDESKLETTKLTKNMKTPDQWVHEDNPPYNYYLYYMFANIVQLNNLRKWVTY